MKSLLCTIRLLCVFLLPLKVSTVMSELAMSLLVELLSDHSLPDRSLVFDDVGKLNGYSQSSRTSRLRYEQLK